MKKDHTGLAIPTFSVQELTANVRSYFMSILDNLKDKLSGYRDRDRSSSFDKINYSPKKSFKSYLPIFIFGFFVVIVVGLIVIMSYRILRSVPKTSAALSVAPATATETLNKEFSFSLKDPSSGKEVSKFKYVIQTAELRSELIVQGQKAISVQGRTFLVLNLKITNDQNQDIKIFTKNYLRLSVNGSSDLTAPEVHNDPVDVQPISTKFTRVAFAINTTDKNLVLHVGEIEGTKQEIKLTIK